MCVLNFDKFHVVFLKCRFRKTGLEQHYVNMMNGILKVIFVTLMPYSILDAVVINDAEDF